MHTKLSRHVYKDKQRSSYERLNVPARREELLLTSSVFFFHDKLDYRHSRFEWKSEDFFRSTNWKPFEIDKTVIVFPANLFQLKKKNLPENTPQKKKIEIKRTEETETWPLDDMKIIFIYGLYTFNW